MTTRRDLVQSTVARALWSITPEPLPVPVMDDLPPFRIKPHTIQVVYGRPVPLHVNGSVGLLDACRGAA